ncbi:hypothetical protein K488DRAFT_84448 [Vararia minispora EC-137]|uniref:Uncharacterized protein n=1 Tax=Vararia minispora EC-137 TaxID=1314806 RepID=A0ACB8QQ46_9AGAM|nr:hypothetical protein K488DRAFT_84448 [Vararia minispora EC-137]
MTARRPLVAAPPRWFDSPDAVHDSRSLGFEPRGRRSPAGTAVKDRDVDGRRDAPHSSSIRPPEHWQPPVLLNSSIPFHPDGDDDFFYRSSPSRQPLSPPPPLPPTAVPQMVPRKPCDSPPSLLRRSLVHDPAFAPDNRFNPNLWETQGVVDPTISESYIVPFAHGFPAPVLPQTSEHSSGRYLHSLQYDSYEPPSLTASPSSSQPSPPSSDESARTTYSSSAETGGSASDRSDEKRLVSEKRRDKDRKRDRDVPPKPSSPLPLPTYEESVSGHSSMSLSAPSSPAGGAFPTERFIDEKPAPVVLSYQPPPPAPEPPPPPRREPVRRQSSRPPPRDLDSIDELDESNPYGVGMHHKGPYEAIAAVLGQASAPQVQGPSKTGKRHKHQPTNPAPSNPLKLDLKPGQILKTSIFQPHAAQPTNPQPYPFQRAPATYPNDPYLHPDQRHPSDYHHRQAGPSRLHRNHTMATTDTAEAARDIPNLPSALFLHPTQDGALLETDPYVFNPLYLIPANVRSRGSIVNGYTTAHPTSDESSSRRRPRGPHDRPPMLPRPNSYHEAQQHSSIPNPYSPMPSIQLDEEPARSSLLNPYSPLPLLRPDDQVQRAPQRFSMPNPYSPLPPVRPDERPIAAPEQPQPYPANAAPSVPFASQEHPRRSSPPSSYSPPRRPSPRQRTTSGPSPYEPPALHMPNPTLNRSSPDVRSVAPSVRTGSPSVRTNGSHGPLPPRHIPRRLVMPTPLATPAESVFPIPRAPPGAAPAHPALPAAPPYLPRGAAPPQPTPPNIRFATPPRTHSPQVQAETIVRYDDSARNLLRKRSAPPPPAPRSGGGFLAVLGFGKTGQKPEVREVLASEGGGAEKMEMRRAQTMKEVRREVIREEKPRRVLSKRK